MHNVESTIRNQNSHQAPQELRNNPNNNNPQSNGFFFFFLRLKSLIYELPPCYTGWVPPSSINNSNLNENINSQLMSLDVENSGNLNVIVAILLVL